MEIPNAHPWRLSPSEAIALQKKLSGRIRLRPFSLKPAVVAGADIAFAPATRDLPQDWGFAAVIAYRFPEMREIERVSAEGPLGFPYIPGLLSFREGALLIAAFRKLKNRPDLIMLDGQGIAHPRRIGIASHIGLWLRRPAIGVAKSLLTGGCKEPGVRRGSTSPLTDGGEVLGAAVRTRDGVKPVFVSPGHLIDAAGAVEWTLHCADGFRLPKPTRQADLWSKELRGNAAKIR